jgi:hypothetical protein
MVEVVFLNGVCPNKWYKSRRRDQPTNTPSRELVNIALSLDSDRIANVRLNVGRILESCMHVFEERDILHIIGTLTKQIENEKCREGGGDVDVMYFASRCIKRAEAIIEEQANDQVIAELHL